MRSRLRTRVNPREKGVAAVEFAFAAILFFTLVFSILDWSYLFFTNLTMQHAVREGARYAVTGQSGLDPGGAGDRCAAAREYIRQQSMGLYEQTSSATTFMTIDPNGNLVNLGGGCYGAGQLIVVQVNSKASPMTPFVRPFFLGTGGEYRFSVSTTMKNEDY